MSKRLRNRPRTDIRCEFCAGGQRHDVGRRRRLSTDLGAQVFRASARKSLNFFVLSDRLPVVRSVQHPLQQGKER